MENETELIIPNGLGLATVERTLKSSSLVTLGVTHWRDLEEKQDYNFQYTINNSLLGRECYF